jgi:regulator of sirC expression with transglutaminase-like and TPR domain
MLYLLIGLAALLEIVSVVLWLIVLIKTFKHEGALKGILGIITCGLFTFIWGWVKHREMEVTKVMWTWTGVIVVGTALAIGLSIMAPMMIMQIAGEHIPMEGIQIPGSDSGDSNRATPRKIQRPASSRAQPQTAEEKAAELESLNQNAVTLWKDGRYANPQQALRYLNNAIKADPKSAVAYNNRGLAYTNLGNFPKAMADFEKALQLAPDYAKAYNNRGIVYYSMKSYQEAINDFTKTIQLDPNYARAYYNRGLAYYQMQQQEQACRDFNQACMLGDCDGQQWASEQGICK